MGERSTGQDECIYGYCEVKSDTKHQLVGFVKTKIISSSGIACGQHDTWHSV